jgi:hypothetical protein
MVLPRRWRLWLALAALVTVSALLAALPERQRRPLERPGFDATRGAALSHPGAAWKATGAGGEATGSGGDAASADTPDPALIPSGNADTPDPALIPSGNMGVKIS